MQESMPPETGGEHPSIAGILRVRRGKARVTPRNARWHAAQHLTPAVQGFLKGEGT